MTTDERRKRLRLAQNSIKRTMKAIRRLNTSLIKWERRARTHEKALAAEEKAALQRRVIELEAIIATPGKRRITLEE